MKNIECGAKWVCSKVDGLYYFEPHSPESDHNHADEAAEILGYIKEDPLYQKRNFEQPGRLINTIYDVIGTI